MKQIKINVYEYHELSPEAKAYAYKEWRKNNDYFDKWRESYEKVLTKLEDRLQVTVIAWSVDEGQGCFKFELADKIYKNAENLVGVRAFKYIMNNVKYTRPKILKWSVNKNKLYYAKVLQEDNDLGFFAGQVLADTVADLYKPASREVIEYLTYENFCEEVLENFFDKWSRTLEYNLSLLYFEENEAAEHYYRHTGDIYIDDYAN